MTEAAGKRLFILEARLGGISRMRVNPHAGEAFQSQAPIDLLIKEIRHGGVLKLDRHRRAALPHHLDVFDQQIIIDSGDPEFV